VFENRVLRRIFGPKRDEVIGEQIQLHNEELNGLGDKIEKNKIGGTCSTYEIEERCMRGFGGET
jgi:hypothetical protein